jgi:hypothetical protein
VSADCASKRRLRGANGVTTGITTNSVEGFFSLLKGGVYGRFTHVGRQAPTPLLR